LRWGSGGHRLDVGMSDYGMPFVAADMDVVGESLVRLEFEYL